MCIDYNKNITFSGVSKPAKALATCIIITLAIGMLGALGQIYVHDIIPTFLTKNETIASKDHSEHSNIPNMASVGKAQSDSRGDLFSDLKTQELTPPKKPLYENEQFVWTLKWTHIHLFGINMIFILLGAITLLLDLPSGKKAWLIVLPFIGVAIDILAMWLKAFISPIFFWLHLPGGGLFAIVFFYVSLRALWEMWLCPDNN